MQRHHLKEKETRESRGLQPFFQLPHPTKDSRILQEVQAGKHRPQGKPRTPHHGETSLGGARVNKVLLRKCFIHPKSSHTIFECNSLRKALGAPLLKETLPTI